jgi:CHAT domain-containing protein/tetratricopeptide (TPR) repeat protein
MVKKFRASSLTLLVISIASSTLAQTPAQGTGKPAAPALINLTGDDEKRAKQLDEHIDGASKSDRWDEAIAKAEELRALRSRVQGPKHFETVDAEWRLTTLRRVASSSNEDRAAYQSALAMDEQARSLEGQGKYKEAEPLLQKALAIFCRLFTDDHPITATSYNNLASILKAEGNYSQAQPIFEKALAIRRRLLTDEHPSTATSYNGLASNLNAQGRYVQAQPLALKALAIRRRLLTDDHRDTAGSYNDVAFNLKAQGKYAQAQPLFEKALEIRRRLLTDEHTDTATSYNNVATNLTASGKHVQAQPLFEKALAIRRRLLTDDHTDTAGSYNNLAFNLAAQGKHAQAQPLYEKALAIRRRLLTDEHPDTATCYNNLASNFRAQGSFAAAQPLYEKALAIRRRLLTDEHPNTATSYNNTALNLSAQGKYAQAQPLFEKALAINRRLLTELHPRTAVSYDNLAGNLDDQGNHAQAQPLHEKALAINRQVLSDDHPDTATSYNNLAGNLDDQGKYAEAQPLYGKALAIYRRRLTDEHPHTAASYNNVAYNLNAQGKYAQAQPLCEKALAIERRLLGEGHRDSATGYNLLAVNLNAQGKYQEALAQWQSATKSLNAARLRIAFTGLERAGGATEPIRPALACVLARLGQPVEAWQTLEDDLGRGLLDELAARQDRRLTTGERASLRELTAALERLDRLVESTPPGLGQVERAKRFEDLKRQRELSSIALGEFHARLIQNHGTLAGKVATLTEIQAAVSPDTALVAWVDVKPVGPNPADPDGEHWGVVVRSRGIPVWVPLPGSGPNGSWTKDDTALADRVRAELRRRPGPGSADLRALVERLRLQRLQPLAKALDATENGLRQARRLIVLTSRAVAGIPVETLLSPGDTRTVSYAPSATVLKYLREQPEPGGHSGLLAMGDPVYQEPDNSSKPGPLPDDGLLVNAPLPGTRDEVEAIAQLFKSADRPTTALLGVDASEPELDRLAAADQLKQFAFIHMATHGVIDEENPERSAVILTQTGLPDPLEQALNHKPIFDGRLLVREIQRTWDLNADLVTLSACETALGRETGGEGFVGFTQALLMSGARSVCLSLWKVDDRATSLLMIRFYQNLLGKRPGLSKPMPKAEALSEAKKWLRGLTSEEAGAADSRLPQGSRGEVRRRADTSVALHPYEHPHFWAAFVLMGDPD